MRTRLHPSRNTGKTLLLSSLVVLAPLGALGFGDQKHAPPAGHPGAKAPTEKAEKPDFPPFEKVIKGLEKVVSTADGAAPLYDLFADKQSGKLLAVLPSGYEKQMLLIACTVSGGDPEAGVMGPTHYVKWRRIDKKLALIAPNLQVRTQGDQQAKDSVAQLYTDRVLASLPITAMAPGGRPVIDLGSMATKQAKSFFNAQAFGYGPKLTSLDASLAVLTKAKTFPENLIVEYEAPAKGGQLTRVTYSIGKLHSSPDFKPRKADSRVGYFYDWAMDPSEMEEYGGTDRYISRWNIQKADPTLAMSPPKQPLVWYVEHTTPIRYRRHVHDGIKAWNAAFEKIGIVGAVEVYQQDSASGAHMEKDPEDARYNFFRWNINDAPYAIGPSRTNPYTGEILDADVVWHQGLTRGFGRSFQVFSSAMALETFGPEGLAWFAEHPDWDPRTGDERGEQVSVEELLHGHSTCSIGNRMGADVALVGAALAAGVVEMDTSSTIDGLPEEFLGAMIRYVAAHEVGHTIGLQHNMAASNLHTLAEINSEGFSGPTVGSVMDYAAVNINHKLGAVQGPYATPEIGPYDYWVIAYGYGPEEKLEEVLADATKPEHLFLSQMAIYFGSDPRNATWDLGADNIEFAQSRLGLIRELREKLVNEIVEDGESWAMTRRRFANLIGEQARALMVMSRWIGGAYESTAFKGDAGSTPPIMDVPADLQRRALNTIIANSFQDSAYGLTPELVRHMGKEYWWDKAGQDEIQQEGNFAAHDLIGQIQGLGLSLLLQPKTLRNAYDNEFRCEEDNAFTMAELVTQVTDSVWTEYGKGGKVAEASSGRRGKREACSSFRRNLQSQHIDRLSDLALKSRAKTPSSRTVATLAAHELRRIDAISEKALDGGLDPYTTAHLEDVRARIARTLDATYVFDRNAPAPRPMMGPGPGH